MVVGQKSKLSLCGRRLASILTLNMDQCAIPDVVIRDELDKEPKYNSVRLLFGANDG